MKLTKENQLRATAFLTTCYVAGHQIGKVTIEKDKSAVAPAVAVLVTSAILYVWTYRGIKAQKAAERK